MQMREIANITAAFIVLAIVIGFADFIKGEWSQTIVYLGYSALILLVPIIAKKWMAYMLDLDVEHEMWQASRYWFRKQDRIDREIPMGIIFPLFCSLISIGLFKVMTFLTYETRARKSRSARRFGRWSYAEITDWHNGIVGAAGVVSLFILTGVAYFLDLEYVAHLAAYYSLFSLVPFFKFDGTQILFGSRVLWTILVLLSILFTLYALFLQ